MPYLPETQELLFDEEERAYVMTNPDMWSYLIGGASPHRYSPNLPNKTLAGTLSLESVAKELSRRIDLLRVRKYRPADQSCRTPTCEVYGKKYADLTIHFKFDGATKTYSPTNFLARRKGAKTYDAITPSNLTFPEGRRPYDRVHFGGYWSQW